MPPVRHSEPKRLSNERRELNDQTSSPCHYFYGLNTAREVDGRKGSAAVVLESIQGKNSQTTTRHELVRRWADVQSSQRRQANTTRIVTDVAHDEAQNRTCSTQ